MEFQWKVYVNLMAIPWKFDENFCEISMEIPETTFCGNFLLE